MAILQFVTTNRDCDALIIPSGIPFVIPENTNLEITQAKGSSITVNVNGQLARISNTDCDALGFSPEDLSIKSNFTNNKIEGPIDLEKVWEQLKNCYDPEIPINIVDLGLIYDCQVEDNNTVHVSMTLTAPACGMGPIIMQDVENAVRTVPNVANVRVEMVFDPVWSRDMISDAGKLELGLL